MSEIIRRVVFWVRDDWRHGMILGSVGWKCAWWPFFGIATCRKEAVNESINPLLSCRSSWNFPGRVSEDSPRLARVSLVIVPSCKGEFWIFPLWNFGLFLFILRNGYGLGQWEWGIISPLSNSHGLPP